MVLQKIPEVSMWCLPKHFKNLLFATLCMLVFSSKAQHVVKAFQTSDSFKYQCNARATPSKIIPPVYCYVINTALAYYPELKNTSIAFRIKKQKSPLVAKPSLGSIFRRASKRKYIITISDATDLKFSSIQLHNLALNAQIGVIGHELAHISDYQKRSGYYFIGMAIGSLNKRRTDRHEYATDMRCIEHGLGYQLLVWSKEVRSKLSITQWKGVNIVTSGARERYMNPETIMHFIARNKIYN